MSLRTRLIIAFLLLSVVPLSAVTVYSYRSSVRAFEAAARREATDTAADVGRRMELITADVGRRMDRMFVDAATPAEPKGESPDTAMLRERVAPMLGDAAALIDRVEFEPAVPPDTESTTGHRAPVVPDRPPADHRVPPPLPPRAGSAAPVPPTPGRIVVDVPRIMEEARRAARTATTSNTDLGALIERSIEQGLPAMEAGLAAAADAMAREADARAGAERTPSTCGAAASKSRSARTGSSSGKPTPP
jgi:hypothetical protein